MADGETGAAGRFRRAPDCAARGAEAEAAEGGVGGDLILIWRTDRPGRGPGRAGGGGVGGTDP